MCINCIRSKVDITEGIQRQIVLFQCRGCERWIVSLHALCLDIWDLHGLWHLLNQRSYLLYAWKKSRVSSCLLIIILGLKNVKLVDAEFVWTEPHSKRIKINITVQKEVFNVVLQQSFVVAFIIEAKTCEDCIMESIEHSTKAVVQLRQKVLLWHSLDFL